MAELRDIMQAGLDAIAVRDEQNDGITKYQMKTYSGVTIAELVYNNITEQLSIKPYDSTGNNPSGIILGVNKAQISNTSNTNLINISGILDDQVAGNGLWYIDYTSNVVKQAPFIPYVDSAGGSLHYHDGTDDQTAALGDISTGIEKSSAGWTLIGVDLTDHSTVGSDALDLTTLASASVPSGASGANSISWGAYTLSSAPRSASFGTGLINPVSDSTVVGKYNDNTLTGYLFAVGNGQDNTVRKTSFYVGTDDVVYYPYAVKQDILDSAKAGVTTETMEQYVNDTVPTLLSTSATEATYRETTAVASTTQTPVYNKGDGNSFPFINGYLLGSTEYSYTDDETLELSSSATAGHIIGLMNFTIQPIVEDKTVSTTTTTIAVPFTPDNNIVFLDGVYQNKGIEYTESGSTQLDFVSTVSAGSKLTLLDFGTPQAIYVSTVTASVGQAQISVNYKKSRLFLFIDGVLADTSRYTATSGSTVELTSAAAGGESISCVCFNYSDETITGIKEYDYTSSASQQTFTQEYIAGQLEVYQQGSKLRNGVDYTATNGTDVILTTGASDLDWVNIHTWE